MAERFERLFMLPDNLYSHGSPVIVVAGTLLRDTQTGKIIAQIKFKNISGYVIKAVKIQLVEYDVMGKEIDGICEYQYVDLHIPYGSSFGSNKAIIMPSTDTKAFAIHALYVIQDNDTVQTITLPFSPLPQPQFLQDTVKHPELIKQFQLEINEKAIYGPQEKNEIWQCSCGEWNTASVCHSCGIDREILFSIYDPEVLIAKTKARLRQEKEKQNNYIPKETCAVEEPSIVHEIKPPILTGNKSEQTSHKFIKSKKTGFLAVAVVLLLILCYAFLQFSGGNIDIPNTLNAETQNALSSAEEEALFDFLCQLVESYNNGDSSSYDSVFVRTDKFNDAFSDIKSYAKNDDYLSEASMRGFLIVASASFGMVSPGEESTPEEVREYLKENIDALLNLYCN